MTVKTLTNEEKQAIIDHYTLSNWQIKKIAQVFAISERTVGRVLDEKGYDRPRAHLNKTVPLTNATVGNYLVKLTEEEYNKVVMDTMLLRTAIKYNISVQAAMLKLEQQTINAVKNQHEHHEPK